MKALITGASSGIGRDMAKYLSSLGYDLIVVARRLDKLMKLKEELRTNVEVVCLDVSTPDNCKQLFERAKDVDILINNAGFGVFGEFDKTDLTVELRLIDTNIIAVHTLTKLFLKYMKQKNKGYILNVSSIAGFMPGPLMATYYASKAYVLRLTESICMELKEGNSNVKVSCLCPGPVDTEFNNVAQVKFKAKALSSKYVAKYAIDQMLKGKMLIIPGKKIKTVKQLLRFGSDRLIGSCSYNVQKKKK